MSNKTIFHKAFLPIFILFFAITLMACFQNHETTYNPEMEAWVDSVFQTMSQDEKIGQLFSIRAHSNLDEIHHLEVEHLVRTYKVGGLCFFQGNPTKEAMLTNRYQRLARIPLMISLDAEWGLAMRLDNAMNFPKQMTLGAIQDDTLIYEMGKEIAYQCKRIGVQVNFAPVVDVNNNPGNPVIGMRSFGENKENVARKGILYMKGLQDMGVMANAKHFPGHGDTDKDSHYTLPVINHGETRLNELELYPFKQLIKNGLQSMMVAHLRIPAYDNTPNRPTTLSPRVVTEVLQNDLQFEGLIFTDALGMKGVADYFPQGEMSVMALLAGNDVLLLPDDLATAFYAVKNALKNARLKWEDIDKKVKKILRGKYFAGLHQYKAVELKNLHQDIHSPKAKVLQEKLYLHALTLVKNQANLIPFQQLDTLTFASVALGTTAKNEFQNMLDNYADFQHFQVPNLSYPYLYNTVLAAASKKKVVIVALNGMNEKPYEGFAINNLQKNLIKQLALKTKVIVVVFGSPYSLKYFEGVEHLICAYENNPITERLVPQAIFGAYPFLGKLPITASNNMLIGTGIQTQSLQKLSYGIPESVGLRSDTLLLVDKMIHKALADQVIPGSQVLIARKGKIVWQKNYGFHDYTKKTPVSAQTIYDIASITKVAGTLQAIAWLYEQGRLDLDKKLSDYFEDLKGTDKEHITVKDLLLHQTGLTPYIPYWEQTLLANKALNPAYYSRTKSEKYPLEVSKGIYSIATMEDTLWKWNVASKLAEKPAGQTDFKYEYSDLNFYFLKKLSEKLLEEKIDVFLEKTFYKPLGMQHTLYNPLQKKVNLGWIPPTEKDTYFRQTTVQGTVHDQGAAMLGGVAGHAGLFSNAKDLAMLLQMYLNQGIYAGKRFLKPETIELFTQKQSNENHRGLGWDKRNPLDGNSYTPEAISLKSFGHSGFTGCVVWADPEQELIFIFLSNRVHPSVDNTKLISEHIRKKIGNLVYKALF
jgi:beta-N-acetylhexosaminidase